MGIIRAETIARARKYIREGVSATRWIREMREKGLGYRHTDMYADYRNVLQLEKKKEVWRYVRKGYIPSERAAEIKAWAMSKEYMYKVRSERILRPGEKPEVTFVNIMQDVPRTIEEIEREAWERSFDQSPPEPAEERSFIVETFVHRAKE